MAMAGDGGGIGGLLKATVADGLMTFLFVFCVSTLGPLTSLILASPLYDSLITFLKSITPPPNLIVTTFILFVFLLILTTIGSLLGGASFNPTSTVAFHAAGFKPNSLISMSLRFPAQALGAVAGAVSISRLMPIPYSRMLPGPRLKVDLHVGAFAECVLTFLVCFGILWVVTRGPNNPVVKVAMIALITVTLVVSGSNYTGPAMNPANAYAWAYVNNHHNTWEHLYVYWMCPFIGSILAAWVFRFIFPPPPPTKAKKLRMKKAKAKEEEKLKDVENTSSTALLQMKARLDALEEVVKGIEVEANKVSHSKVATKDGEGVKKEQQTTIADGDAKQSLKTN